MREQQLRKGRAGRVGKEGKDRIGEWMMCEREGGGCKRGGERKDRREGKQELCILH